MHLLISSMKLMFRRSAAPRAQRPREAAPRAPRKAMVPLDRLRLPRGLHSYNTLRMIDNRKSNEHMFKNCLTQTPNFKFLRMDFCRIAGVCEKNALLLRKPLPHGAAF